MRERDKISTLDFLHTHSLAQFPLLTQLLTRPPTHLMPPLHSRPLVHGYPGSIVYSLSFMAPYSLIHSLCIYLLIHRFVSLPLSLLLARSFSCAVSSYRLAFGFTVFFIQITSCYSLMHNRLIISKMPVRRQVFQD